MIPKLLRNFMFCVSALVKQCPERQEQESQNKQEKAYPCFEVSNIQFLTDGTNRPPNSI